jgi:hypothetical protein
VGAPVDDNNLIFRGKIFAELVGRGDPAKAAAEN